MNFRALSSVIVLSVLTPHAAGGQSLVNPDISAIADMRYVYRDDVAAALAEQNNGSFEFEELELAFIGYLNPYMRADFYLGIHGVTGPFELEEGYASVVRGLPVQLRFGKYLLDFGRINTQHPHQWGWLERPLMYRTVFGDEGAGVIGLGASRLQGIGDNAVTLSLSAFRSDFFEIPAHDAAETEEDNAHGGEGVTDIGGAGRISLFRSLTENTHVEIGGSGLAARYDHEHGLDAWLAGGDFKFHWRPDSYRSFNLIAETVYGERDVKLAQEGPVENVTAWGAFSSAEFRFRKKYDVGAYADWTEDAYVQDAETTALGGYVGFMPVEETARFSLVYRHEESDLYAGASDSVTFQVLWSLGPHKPHPF
jgi:hypothetical protein